MNANLLFRLPNHSWAPLNTPVAVTHPECVVRRAKFGILIRDRAFGERIRFDYSAAWCGTNRPNETWSPFDLWIWGDYTVNILTRQAEEDENVSAALELVRLATLATYNLTRICKANPQLVHDLAKVRRGWPVIKKKNERLTTQEKQLFKAIRLGEEDFIENEIGQARQKLDDAGEIAYYLISYIDTVRKNTKSSTFDYGFIRDAAQKLPNFTDGTKPIQKWWSFAKDILLISYPEPETVDEFKQLIPSTNKKSLRSPGILRQSILDKLKARFVSNAKSSQKRRDLPTCDCGAPAITKMASGWICDDCRKLAAYQTKSI